MQTLAPFLGCVAPAFLLVGALHLVFGVGADVMLGANLPPHVVADPGLNSQNRFYGVSFTLYGVLLFVCASDIPKYETVLRCLLLVLFAGGLARLVSLAAQRVPPPLMVGLLVSELVVPPLLLSWLASAKNAASRGTPVNR